MAYNRTTWVDYVTALSAANMNNIEEELVDLDGSAMRSHNLGTYSVPSTWFAEVVNAAYAYVTGDSSKYDYLMYFRFQGMIGFIMWDSNDSTYKFAFGKLSGAVVRNSSTSFSVTLDNMYTSEYGYYSGSSQNNNIESAAIALRQAALDLKSHVVLKYCRTLQYDLRYTYQADGAGGPNVVHVTSCDATGQHISGYVEINTPLYTNLTLEKTKGVKFFEYDNDNGFYNISEVTFFKIELSDGKVTAAQRQQLDELYYKNTCCLVFFSGRLWMYDRSESEAINEDDDEGLAYFWQVPSASQFPTFTLTSSALKSKAVHLGINLLSGVYNISEISGEAQVMASIRENVLGGETTDQLLSLANINSIINILSAQYINIAWNDTTGTGSYGATIMLDNIVAKRLPVRIQGRSCYFVDSRFDASAQIIYYDYETSYVVDNEVVHAIFSISNIDDTNHTCDITYRRLDVAGLVFTNVSASTWVADSTYSDYGYKCELACQGITANSVVEVIFGVAEAISGNYAPVCLSGSNIVTIYSKVNTSITIPTIKEVA